MDIRKSNRFVDFVTQYAGHDYLDILGFFDADIEPVAQECRINWLESKNNLVFGHQAIKNKHPAVVGLTKADKGRVYIWTEIRLFERDGWAFSYPVITFKSRQNTYGQPGKQFNALTFLFKEFERFSSTGEINKKKNELSESEKATRLALQAQSLRRKERKRYAVRKKESMLFNAMGRLAVQGLFSVYLKNKHVEDVASDFDIRIGKNQHGYFTCFALYNVHGDFGGLQRIFHNTPPDSEDNKYISAEFNPISYFSVFGEKLACSEIVYICEGLATALAIYKATGRTVVVCLMAENIGPVSEVIARYYPTVKRVHVADNDCLKPEFGNTGVHHCALAVQRFGGWVFVPQPSVGTDACDVLVHDGLTELKRQLYECKTQYFNGHFSQAVGGLFNYVGLQNL